MKKQIKLIVTDIDGTIANEANIISDNVKKCFANLQKNGVKVVVATGRMLPAAEIMAKRLNLDTPLIAYQGAIIQQDANSKPIWAKYVDKDCALKIIKNLKQRGVHQQVYINDEILVEHDNDIVKAYSKKMETGYRVVENLEVLDLSAVQKILAINLNPEIAYDVMQKGKEEFKEKLCITLSTPYFCEFTNPLAHKGAALEFLAQYYGIPIEQTMAFGDQNNDITMIKTAGIGVAVGNATEELKQAADFVTKTISEDGVVYAIEKFVDLGVENVKL